MKESNQKKTRFEVGMPVIYLNGGYAIEVKVTSLENKTASEFGKRHPIVVGWNQGVSYLGSTFTNDGFATEDQAFPSLFTIPEYQAIKALTDSFVDGTFGTTAKRQDMVFNSNPNPSTLIKFEPQGGEMVLYGAMECEMVGIEKRSGLVVVPNGGFIYTLKMPSGVTTETNGSNLQPVEGYQYANGFCIPILKEEQADIEQNAQPTPETTDLLDENGRPVYFEIGMKVGHLGTGMTGMVCRRDNSTKEVCVDFDSDVKWFTFDGKVQDSDIQAIYPIAQYNQIQLPKLHPIQVPKEDVIELPSWFKGGVVIPMYSISEYLTKNTSKDIKDKLNEFILIANGNKYAEVEFYEMTKRVIEHEPPIRAIKFAFVCKSMYFEGYLDLDGGQNSYLARMYELNTNPVEEVLTDENNWHICE